MNKDGLFMNKYEYNTNTVNILPLFVKAISQPLLAVGEMCPCMLRLHVGARPTLSIKLCESM